MATIQIRLGGKLAADRGLVALVDEVDAARVSLHGWRAHQPDKAQETFYAVACTKRDGKWRTTYMHRVLLDAPSGAQVDHRDGNGLNNTRGNLRICNQSQNNANWRGVRSASGFRGVYRRKGDQKFFAGIQKNRKFTTLGRFDSPEDAARAYDAAARQMFGEFARPNFEV